MSRICRFALVVFVAAYLSALFVLAAGTFGWFGVAKDPLSAVFLIPLGLPWNAILPASPAVGLLSPAVNGVIMLALCKRLSRSRDNKASE